MGLINIQYTPPKARIELLPLIDVIFLLLVCFIIMILNTSVQNSIKINLPTLSTEHLPPKNSLQITLSADNQLYINNKPTTSEKIIQDINNQSIQQPIRIQGDKTSDLGAALQLLHQLQIAGFHQVSFSSKP